MGSQGGQQGQRTLASFFASLHNWKVLKKAHVYGKTSISLPQHSGNVNSGNVELLYELTRKSNSERQV